MDPVIEAVFRRDLRGLKEILAENADANGRDSDGRTPLMHAAIEGADEMVTVLLAAGAQVNSADKGGYTALHFAAQEFNVETARRLLGSGAAVDAKDSFGNTPLGRAVFESKGRIEMIQLLLSRGADKTIKNNNDVSPKELAGKIANYDVAQLL